jgi:hypothetical protein
VVVALPAALTRTKSTAEQEESAATRRGEPERQESREANLRVAALAVVAVFNPGEAPGREVGGKEDRIAAALVVAAALPAVAEAFRVRRILFLLSVLRGTTPSCSTSEEQICRSRR